MCIACDDERRDRNKYNGDFSWVYAKIQKKMVFAETVVP